MKKLSVLLAFMAIAVIALTVTTCASSGGTSGGGEQTGPLWEGDGGQGRSIAILELGASGLDEGQRNLTNLVQGELVSNFSGYSAISVLDRVTLERQYAELLSGYYSDNEEAGWDLGRLPATDYLMFGNITRTGSNFHLQLSVTQNSDKMTVARYSATVSRAELENFSGIRRASLDLLQKLEVQPTARARAELTRAAERSHIDAMTALSQGIVNQRQGNEFEALTNYFEARTFDARIPEVSTRFVSASQTLTANRGVNTGSALRDYVTGEIAQRREADRLAAERRQEVINLINKAAAFYIENPPFHIAIDDKFAVGNIDHRAGTADVRVSISMTPIASEFAVIRELALLAQREGVASRPDRQSGIPSNQQNEVDGWPFLNYHRERALTPIWNYSMNLDMDLREQDPLERVIIYRIEADILNERGRVIQKVTFNMMNADLNAIDNAIDRNASDHLNIIIVLVRSGSGPFGFRRILSSGEVFTVNPDNLSDTLTMRLTSVNGRSLTGRNSVNIRGPREQVMIGSVDRVIRSMGDSLIYMEVSRGLFNHYNDRNFRTWDWEAELAREAEIQLTGQSAIEAAEAVEAAEREQREREYRERREQRVWDW